MKRPDKVDIIPAPFNPWEEGWRKTSGFAFIVDMDTFFVVHNRKVYEVAKDVDCKERPDLDWRKML